MPPADSVRENKVSTFRKMYGVRLPDGTINGKLHSRWIISDIMKGILIVLAGYLILGTKGMYDWYQKNRDLPAKYEIHCDKQVDMERLLAGQLGRIEQKLDDLSPRRRQNDR